MAVANEGIHQPLEEPNRLGIICLIKQLGDLLISRVEACCMVGVGDMASEGIPMFPKASLIISLAKKPHADEEVCLLELKQLE